MEQFGDRIGVTKQTVSNLERGKPKMTKLQYIAIRSVFESEAKERDGEEKEILLKILDLVCDPDPDVSEVQRSEALNTAAGSFSFFLLLILCVQDWKRSAFKFSYLQRIVCGCPGSHPVRDEQCYDRLMAFKNVTGEERRG